VLPSHVRAQRALSSLKTAECHTKHPASTCAWVDHQALSDWATPLVSLQQSLEV
jgi:hypothetical protein